MSVRFPLTKFAYTKFIKTYLHSLHVWKNSQGMRPVLLCHNHQFSDDLVFLNDIRTMQTPCTLSWEEWSSTPNFLDLCVFTNILWHTQKVSCRIPKMIFPVTQGNDVWELALCSSKPGAKFWMASMRGAMCNTNSFKIVSVNWQNCTIMHYRMHLVSLPHFSLRCTCSICSSSSFPPLIGMYTCS